MDNGVKKTEKIAIPNGKQNKSILIMYIVLLLLLLRLLFSFTQSRHSFIHSFYGASQFNRHLQLNNTKNKTMISEKIKYFTI